MIRLQTNKIHFRLAMNILRANGLSNITMDTIDYSSNTISCSNVETAEKAKNILKRERIPSTIIDQTEVQ